jgi:hypothetical protein
MPERIQLSRRKGWRMPPNTVSVARPTKWGNPYTLKTARLYRSEEDPRRVVVDAFRDAILSGMWPAEDLRELRGKNLACWCALDAECHADVLLELANSPPGGA